MRPSEQAAADLEALRTVRARLVAEAEQQEKNARVCRAAAETARDAWGERKARAAEQEAVEAAKALRLQVDALGRSVATLERRDVLVQETCALVARAKALEAEPAFAGAGTIDFGGVCATCFKPGRECHCIPETRVEG